MQENPMQTSQSTNPSQNQSAPVSSYQQYQQQRFMQQERQSAMAQQAIMKAGADSFSQKVMDTVNALRSISNDLVNAQKQLEAQIYAQQRQLKQMQQNIDNVITQVQNTYKSSTGSTLLQ